MDITADPVHDAQAFDDAQDAAKELRDRAIDMQLDHLITNYKIKRTTSCTHPEYPEIYRMLNEFSWEMDQNDFKAVSECLGNKDGKAYIKDETELGRVVGKFLVQWLDATAEQLADEES